jgi:hypothetical protein
MSFFDNPHLNAEEGREDFDRPKRSDFSQAVSRLFIPTRMAALKTRLTCKRMETTDKESSPL